MDLRYEFRRIREEQKRRVADEARTKAEAVAREVERRGLAVERAQSRKRAIELLLRRYDEEVRDGLSAIGDETWGRNAYTIISPSEGGDAVWYALRTQGKTRGYSVKLDVRGVGAAELSEAVNKKFTVEGRLTTITDCVEEGLMTCFESGPGELALAPYAERMFLNAGYRQGECDPNEKSVLVFGFALLSVILGIVVIQGSNSVPASASVSVLGTIFCAIVGLTIAALTRVGTRFNKLPTWAKLLAVGTATPSAIWLVVMVVFAVAGFIIGLALAAFGVWVIIEMGSS